MANVDRLRSLSAETLLIELRRRETLRQKGDSATPAAGVAEADLSAYDDATLLRAVERVQRSIYGEDNRHDLFELPAGANRDDADSLVAIVRTNFMTDNGDDTTTLTTSNFGTSENLCPGQRFSSQPTVGPGIKCSGFLVSADVIATAGRCIYTNADLSGLRFVFGFRMRDAVEAQTVINNVTSIAV